MSWATSGQVATVLIVVFVIAYVVLLKLIVRGARKDAAASLERQKRERSRLQVSGRTRRSVVPRTSTDIDDLPTDSPFFFDPNDRGAA